MFLKALINTDGKLTQEQKRLQSSIRLVADDCIPATFYYHNEWAKLSILNSLGLDAQNLDSRSRNIIEDMLAAKGFSRDLPTTISDGMPRLVYISHNDWEQKKHGEGGSQLPVKVPKDEFIYANSDFFHKIIMEDRGVSANTAILCLAAVGLDISLPNISLDMMAEEEIEKIRTELSEERVSYLNAITKIADETYDRFREKDFNEIMNWAQNEVTFKLIPKVRNIEKSVLKLDKKTIDQAKLKVWKDGIPAITSGYMEGGLAKAAQVSIEELLKIINHILLKKSSERKLPEIAYAAKIHERINSQKVGT